MLKNETPVSFACCLSLVSYDSHHREKLYVCSELNSPQNVYFGFFQF